MTSEVRLSLILSPELNQTLDDMAERAHSTKSEMLRKAIVLYDVILEVKRKEQRLGILDQQKNLITEIVGL